MIQTIDKLAWIQIVDGEILMTRSYGKASYYIPGGKREGDETDVQALRREIKEELTVDLIEDSISYLGRFEAQADGKAEGVNVIMRCYTGDYHGEISASSEIEEVAWFSFRDKHKSSFVDHLIFDYLFERKLIG